MSTLRPVPFKNGRAHLPRLSEPYKPGKRHERYWTEEEDVILRELYPHGGAAACADKLPNRDLGSIYARARKFRLKCMNPGGARQKLATDELDARIREEYPKIGPHRGATKELAARLGVPRWWLSKRATQLGLTTLRRKEPPWTATEDELLARVPLYDPHRAAVVFREHGFKRTPTAIVIRAKRVGLSRRRTDVFSASAAARVLGIDSKTMTTYILGGLLQACRRGTNRLPQQGGDTWSVERAELRRFIIDNIAIIDIRKVDKVAFVDLLADAPNAPPPQAAPPPPGAAPESPRHLDEEG